MKVKDIVDYIYTFAGVDVYDADRQAYVAECKGNHQLQEWYDYELLIIVPVNEDVLQLTISKN